MIRVMIVEDEPPIMRVITKYIEAFSGTFKIVHTAINGRKALEFLEDEMVDIVFTDIRMPVMDGLELTEHIKERLPETMVVIISGFQDFEYARKALQFQVYDYLLKPLSQDAINQVLSKIESELLIKDKAKQRQRIMSAINENHLEEETEALQPGYAVFLICAGAFPLVPNDSMLPARSVWEDIDLHKQLSSILIDEENSMCFNGKTASEIVAVFEVKDEARIEAVAEALYENIKAESFFPITLVSAEYSVKLSDIGKMLEALRAKLYVSVKLFTSQRLGLDKKDEAGDLHLDTQLITETIESSAKLGNQQLISATLTALRKFADINFTQLQAAAFFYDAINTICFKKAEASKDTSTLKMDLDIAISNAVDDRALAKDIAFIILGLYEQEASQSEKNNMPDIAAKIENYLQIHYKEPITTTMLSKKFGFVPSYISKLFRIYKGMSPSEYLTYYRIEKSKQILLNEPELLCKEVAGMVGFSDQYHFSKTFKKHVGIWPTEYVVKK